VLINLREKSHVAWDNQVHLAAIPDGQLEAVHLVHHTTAILRGHLQEVPTVCKLGWLSVLHFCPENISNL
jgi:hypothetical protein